MMKFDTEHQVQDYTFILSTPDHRHIGQLKNVDSNSIGSNLYLNSADELSFTVYRDSDVGEKELYWDKITDFKYIYVKELDSYYCIKVDVADKNSVYKNVIGTSAGEVELSQIFVYGTEINTPIDIAREDYINPTIFYKPDNPKESALHRILTHAPQYSVEYVDESLWSLQRTWSFDKQDVYSVLTNDITTELNCLFEIDNVKRTISVYDLMTVCRDCGYRGEYEYTCPKCGSKNVKYFGDDTTIIIDTENLAQDITITTDTESMKNCFKLVAGDDNMTAAIINSNPNGSDKIYYFSQDQKNDMRPELVEKINSYDKLYESYQEEYSQVMDDIYEAIDKIVYYTSSMMPTREQDPSSSKTEADKLTEANMSPMGLSELTRSTSTVTVNTALRNYAKVFVKSGYFKVDVNEGEFVFEGTDSKGMSYGYWYGNFKVTNYSDEDDVTISEQIRIQVNDDYRTFLEQKIAKKIVNEKDEDGSIFDVLNIETLQPFTEALKLYSLNRLKSFLDAIQGVLDVMIEADQAHDNSDLYKELYEPYYNKLLAVQRELDVRQKTIDKWNETYNTAIDRQREIHKILDFEEYLGRDLYLEFCVYKREDVYQNDNYISDGFTNDEVFDNARKFIDVAKTELIKAAEPKYTISTTMGNLLVMKEFKPIRDKFKMGNFIRIKIDNKVYRLKLIHIGFNSKETIDVDFSTITRVLSPLAETKDILNQSKSMATSYNATIRQVQNSKEQTDIVKNWNNIGLDMTMTKIVNNADNQTMVMDDKGLLARRKEDYEDKFSPYQTKMISNGIYTTSDGWRTIDTAIGQIMIKDQATGKLKIMYGVNGRAIVGELILGELLNIQNEDGTLSFDDRGLVIDSSGNSSAVFQIRKNGIPQLFIDGDGNIVLGNGAKIMWADIDTSDLNISISDMQEFIDLKNITNDNFGKVNVRLESIAESIEAFDNVYVRKDSLESGIYEYIQGIQFKNHVNDMIDTKLEDCVVQDDLKNYVTIEMLGNYVQQDDLKDYVTFEIQQETLSRYLTKIEFENFKSELDARLQNIEIRLTALETSTG